MLLLAEKWQRAGRAQQRWAEPAKVCVDYYFEGRQWTAAQLVYDTRLEPILSYIIADEISPIRTFGEHNEDA